MVAASHHVQAQCCCVLQKQCLMKKSKTPQSQNAVENDLDEIQIIGLNLKIPLGPWSGRACTDLEFLRCLWIFLTHLGDMPSHLTGLRTQRHCWIIESLSFSQYSYPRWCAWPSRWLCAAVTAQPLFVGDLCNVPFASESLSEAHFFIIWRLTHMCIANDAGFPAAAARVPCRTLQEVCRRRSSSHCSIFQCALPCAKAISFFSLISCFWNTFLPSPWSQQHVQATWIKPKPLMIL